MQSHRTKQNRTKFQTKTIFIDDLLSKLNVIEAESNGAKQTWTIF
jgi:hypothetical protein